MIAFSTGTTRCSRCTSDVALGLQLETVIHYFILFHCCVFHLRFIC